MAPRIARSSVTGGAPKAARKKNKKRSLDAYAQAQKLVPDKGIAKHRLGEDLDDEPRHKRRRRDDDEEDEDGSGDLEPQKKRQNRRTTGLEDDDVEYGSDSDGNEWTIGGIAVGEDDSDLDSDAAFGESDEEKFAGFTFRGSSKRGNKAKERERLPKSGAKGRKRDIELDEREESEEDFGDSEDEEGLGLGDDAVDLAAMLDDADDEVLGGKDNTKRDFGEDSESEGDEEESEESASEAEAEEEDADNEERIARMRDRLEALDSASHKTSAPEPTAAATLDDFLEDTGLEIDKAGSKGRKKATKPTTIAAPLPKRQQNKLDREVASRKAKEQLDRWRDTVIRNRRAEFLNFPLQTPADQTGTLGKEKFIPSNNQPHNELEQSIQRIMEESGLAANSSHAGEDGSDGYETALLKAEGLAEKKMDVEEVMRRRAELRRTRELLFREERKAARLAKIKSKSYRRVHRKERQRQLEKEREALEGMGVDPMDEDDKERSDRKRAEARMSTKHKDSKWAKSLKQTNRTAWDEDARDGVIEQARRAEELKRRMAGNDISDDSDADESLSEGDDDVDENAATLKRLDALDAPSVRIEGVAGMDFMRKAEERRRKANDEDIERLRKDLAREEGDESDESNTREEPLGRAIFGPQPKEKRKPDFKQGRLEFEAPEEPDENGPADAGEEQEAIIITGTEDFKNSSQPDAKEELRKSSKPSGPLAAGWLSAPPEEEQDTAKPNAWLTQTKKKSKGADVHIDAALDLAAIAQPVRHVGTDHGKAVSNGTAGNTAGWTTIPHKENSASDASDDDTDDPILGTAQQKLTYQQRAFAGDDVQAAFEAEKQDLEASEDEKEVSTHLPGWGSWTGDGLSKSIKKANARAKHNPLFKTKVDGVKQANRKDAKLENVIISERNERKGRKYLAPMLPHEFETKEQYERSRRVPVGPEWTTKEVHQRMTRPRVVVKKGVNVQALERPVA